MNDSPSVGPRTNLVLSLIILAACGLGWLAIDTLPRGLTVDPVGPAYFPRFILLCILGLALALLIASLRDLRRSVAEPAPEPLPMQEAAARAAGTAPEHEDEEPLPPFSYPRMLAVLGWSTLYVLAIERLGYFISTLVYVVVLLLMLRVRNALAVAGCALGIPLVLQALFQKLLTVPLPGGLLDNLPFELPF